MVLHLVKTFKLSVSQIHYDISSVELYGDYGRQMPETPENVPEQDASPSAAEVADAKKKQGPQPMYGRTKSGRKNVKQVQFGINVTRDGAVPIDLLPFDGNEAEVKTHIQNLERLRKLLPTTDIVYTADTKMDSPENLLANKAAGGRFLCCGVFQPHLKKEYVKHRGEMKPVDYCPKSKLHLPEKNLNKYSLKTREKIVSRLESAKGKYSVGDVFRYDLKGRAGTFSLSWHINESALRELENLDGAYVLKTDLAKKEFPTGRVLQEYKEQIHVERRIGDVKGPLAIAPLFLEKPLRIAGLMYILLWALISKLHELMQKAK